MTDDTIKPTELPVTLYQGDDMVKVQEAFQAVREAERKALQIEMATKGASQRLGDESPADAARAEVKRLAGVYDALVDEAKPRAKRVLIRALPRKKWRAMVRGCPPRADNKGDEALGFDEEALGDQLVPECLVEPDMKPQAKEAFLDSLSDAQFELLYNAAYTVNRGSVPDPKADMSSMFSLMYAETSTSPGRLG